MHLSKEENEMLEGKYGYPVQKAMEILVGLGECFDAEKMIPVTSVHLQGSSLMSSGKAGSSFIQEIAGKGGNFIIFTDTNPKSLDPWYWREIGISEEFVDEQTALTNALAKMGAFLCHSCTPYQIGHVPRLGEHIAWGESSAIIFANSVLGARTNREGGASGMASALTGRTPEYGLHLDENRCGDLEISVKVKLNDLHDYGTLGYFTGSLAEDRVPVFTGLPSSVTWDELKFLGASAATSGSVALFHVVGVTPEAPTKEAGFGSKKMNDWPKYEFGEKELRETEALISKASGREIDLVVLGCPFVSIKEFKKIAQLLSGKKIKSSVEFWVLSCRMMRDYAEVMGYLSIIETSGAKVMCEVCPSTLPRGLLKEHGHKTAVTNSAKIAYYMAGGQGVLSHYGSMEKCVEAAISGFWG